jgi:hypothetical protein
VFGAGVRLLALALVGTLLCACGGGGGENAAPEPAQRDGVTDLANILRLRADFEASAGRTRVLLLFSPT